MACGFEKLKPEPGVKPSQALNWLGFGLAYTAWLGLAPGFQAKPAHH